MSNRLTTAFIASLLGTTALVSSALAQDSAQTAADPQACETLRVLNDENADTFNEEFVVGANDIVARADPAECGPWLAEAESALEENEGADLSATGGRIVVTQPEPSVSVDQADPQVSVRQEDPSVSVRQGQPEIIVRQQQPTIRVEMPQPTITIDQPEPQIIVRMPDPEVAVSTPEPEVSVSQSAPEVNVEQQQPQIAVDEPTVDVEEQDEANIEVERGQPVVRQEGGSGEASVDIQESQPVVRYEAAEPNIEFEESGEPNVQYNQSGEPDIQFEEMGENSAMEQNGAAAGQTQGDDQYASLRASDETMEAGEPMTVAASDIIGRDVVNGEDEQLGSIERLVYANDRVYAVLAEGGFLGLGEREVALPLDAMSMRGDEVLLRGMTDDDIDALPEFDASAAQEYSADEQVQLNSL